MKLTIDVNDTVAEHLLSDEHVAENPCFFAEAITAAVVDAARALRGEIVTGCAYTYEDSSVCTAEPEHHGANGLPHAFVPVGA